MVTGGAGIVTQNIGGGVHSATITGLVNGITYAITLQTVDKIGNISTGINVSGTPVANSPSPIPTREPVPPTKIRSKDGNLTLPAGSIGVVSLEDEVIVSIPAGAISNGFIIKIVKVVETPDLTVNGEVLVSPVFEITKDFTGNFNKPISLTIVFNS